MNSMNDESVWIEYIQVCFLISSWEANVSEPVLIYDPLVNPSTKHTVGVEFGMKYEKVNNKTIKL